jgi:hypothetical protein
MLSIENTGRDVLILPLINMQATLNQDVWFRKNYEAN